MQGGVIAKKNGRRLRIYAIISKMAINIYRFYLHLDSHDLKLVYQRLSMAINARGSRYCENSRINLW